MDVERVVGYIPAVRMKTGLFGSKAYTLVFTDRRLLFAELTDRVLTRLVTDARAAAKASGGGFMGQWGAQLEAAASAGRQYLAMTPEAILAETPGNLAVTPAEVRRLEIRRESREGSGGLDKDCLKIRIELAGRKLDLETEAELPPRDEALAMARRAFGPAVR